MCILQTTTYLCTHTSTRVLSPCPPSPSASTSILAASVCPFAHEEFISHPTLRCADCIRTPPLQPLSTPRTAPPQAHAGRERGNAKRESTILTTPPLTPPKSPTTKRFPRERPREFEVGGQVKSPPFLPNGRTAIHIGNKQLGYTRIHVEPDDETPLGIGQILEMRERTLRILEGRDGDGEGRMGEGKEGEGDGKEGEDEVLLKPLAYKP